MEFVCLTEYNDHEGERWRFWLQYTGNEQACLKLKHLLDEDDFSEDFKLDFDLVPESDVDVLVMYTFTGYMDVENKLVGTFAFEDLQTDMAESKETVDEILYKGLIRNYFKA